MTSIMTKYEGTMRAITHRIEDDSLIVIIKNAVDDDDYPIGTHGSTTLLCLTASCIKKRLEDSTVEIERAVANGLCAIAKEIPALSKRRMSRLCNFIQFAEIPLRLYGSAYREFFNNWKTPRRILNRALLLRLLSEGGEHFSLEELEKEKEIKEKYPWFWIDAAVGSRPGYGHPEIAINEIKRIVKEDKRNIHNHALWLRLLPYAFDCDSIEKLEKAIRELQPFINNDDFNDLKEECSYVRECLREDEQARFWLINRIVHLLSERR